MNIGFFIGFDKTARDIGAVIGNSLQIRQHVLEDIAEFNGAFVVLQTAYMAIFQFCAEIIDNFFKRFDLMSDCEIVVNILQLFR